MNAIAFDPAELDVVFARSLRDTERIGVERLLLTFDPSAEATLRGLAARVPFAIDVRQEDGQLLAELSLPADLVDEVVLRAETADLRALRWLRALPAA
ncbi:hypothetical protein [Pseudonocardia xishanensis]|uniref:Uncharacterized protein n=1 Tax=Pseudonocardia xishanensis TaxID=630995 RepID=A0ABP8RKR3_9PSEU